MITVSEAKQIIQDAIPPPQSEMVTLDRASGRILAQEIRALFPMPRFTNSAMDGFAVRAEDTLGASPEAPIELKLVGAVSAGITAEFSIEKGECAQCMTGAPLPRGANAIVMVEQTTGFTQSSPVSIYQPVEIGKHVRHQGEEIREGEILLAPGIRINAAEIGVLANFGYGVVQVGRQPQIAIFATGDELVAPGEQLTAGQIYNSNLPVLIELARKVGAEVKITDVLHDSRTALEQFIAKVIDTCDVIISSGGISMGKYDYVRDVLLNYGVTEHFWKVAQKPAKPLFFGSIRQTIIFGLPGNPVSAFIGFMEYIWPVLEQWMGIQPAPKLEAKLVTSFPRDPQKYRFLFGRSWIEKGLLVCAPVTKLGSHMLSATLGANCIIGVDKGNDPLKPGTAVNIQLLPWKSIGPRDINERDET